MPTRSKEERSSHEMTTPKESRPEEGEASARADRTDSELGRNLSLRNSRRSARSVVGQRIWESVDGR